MKLVSLTVFLSGLQWPLSAVSYSWLFCFLQMKMKMKKENNRFNAEIVVANYRFSTWNIVLLKVSQVRFVKFCAEGKLRFAYSGGKMER